MAILKSKTRAQGGSVSTTIPSEAVRRMGVDPGTELYWVEDGQGGSRVSPVNPERTAMLEAHEEVMTEYREVFSALAK